MSGHASHADIVKRLARTGPCCQYYYDDRRGRLVSTLLSNCKRLKKAIANAKILVHDHIDHCLERAGA